MSAREDAFVSWCHHNDLDALLRKGQAFKAAFMAGWANAGGDERLAAIDKLQEFVAGCCDGQAGNRFCESFGCSALNETRKLLGDEVDE